MSTLPASLDIAYLNGRFAPLGELKIPVLDRGFLFGDAIYEVMPVYQGRPFRSESHYRRLERSLLEIRLQPPLDLHGWKRLVAELIERNGAGSMAVYMQVSRGAPALRNHAIPEHATPTVFAMASPLRPRDSAILEKGMHVITRPDTRWARCDIKSTSLLANVLLYSEAAREGVQECVLFRDGYVTEASTSSLFAVIDGKVCVPPYFEGILPGTTRDLVVELCEENGTPAQHRPISVDELPSASELWLSSATRELMPVTRLDGKEVADGRPGPLWRQIDARFQARKQECRDD